MEKIKYESPKFDFQELRLMERVADTCWGFHYGWYDPDGTGPLPAERIDLAAFGSCKSVEDELVAYINGRYGANITGDDVKTNTHNSVVTPAKS